MTIADLYRHVEVRAAGRCEYCRMHQSLQGATFHVEHIVPRAKGGATMAMNLAWACPACNLHKSSRTHGTDPASRAPTRLFDPRRDVWDVHFTWNGYEILGITDVGAATIEALQLNSPRRQQVRQAEERFDLFPP